MRGNCDDALIEDIFKNPKRYKLYGTGSLEHYLSNKLLFPSDLIFMDASHLINQEVTSNDRTVVILFSPTEENLCKILRFTEYKIIELCKFIDYKAKIFWGEKGEYKGIDKNHYMSNEVVLRELAKNKNLLDLVPRNRQISVLSLGCGTGNLERELLKFDNIVRIDAFDISEESLATAREKIKNHPRKNIIDYESANLNDVSFKKDSYDLVLAQECIHHIQNLESLYENIGLSLKEGGQFLQFEYVGPKRFQFEDYIIEIVNCILNILPQRYNKGPYKRTTEYDIIQADPSEAIRSTDIIFLTESYFKNTSIHYHSGTLMHILHQRLNMDYFYSLKKVPVKNFIRSIVLTKLVFFIEKLILEGRYSHLALLKSYKR